MKETFEKLAVSKRGASDIERSGSVLPESGGASSADDRSSINDVKVANALAKISDALELLSSKPVLGTGLLNSESGQA